MRLLLLLLLAMGQAESLPYTARDVGQALSLSERGRIVERVATMRDPSITYAYYLPSHYDPAKRWPILYVFDPRKRGPLGAELFREAAEEYGWIVVSSNDTSSNADWEPNSKAISAMWPDALHRFSVDPRRIYATGMSGGAIMAWSLAKSTKAVAGVIGCSGRLTDDHDTDNVTFDWFGTAGINDFNFSETRLIESKLAAAHVNYRVEIFDGGHQWPPESLAREAVEWMELQAMRRGSRAQDDAFIARMLERDLAAAAKLDDVNAMRRYDAIVRTFDGLGDVRAAKAKADELRASPVVKRALRDENRVDAFEKSAKQRMVRAIHDFLQNDQAIAAAFAQDLDIPHLRKLARGTDYEAAAARRVLEVTGIQLRMLANDLDHRGRALRASVVREVEHQAAGL